MPCRPAWKHGALTKSVLHVQGRPQKLSRLSRLDGDRREAWRWLLQPDRRWFERSACADAPRHTIRTANNDAPPPDFVASAIDNVTVAGPGAVFLTVSSTRCWAQRSCRRFAIPAGHTGDAIDEDPGGARSRHRPMRQGTAGHPDACRRLEGQARPMSSGRPHEDKRDAVSGCAQRMSASPQYGNRTPPASISLCTKGHLDRCIAAEAAPSNRGPSPRPETRRASGAPAWEARRAIATAAAHARRTAPARPRRLRPFDAMDRGEPGRRSRALPARSRRSPRRPRTAPSAKDRCRPIAARSPPAQATPIVAGRHDRQGDPGRGPLLRTAARESGPSSPGRQPEGDESRREL